MNKPKVGDPQQSGERWCNMCSDWRGIITTGSELDTCPACKDWRWKKNEHAGTKSRK